MQKQQFITDALTQPARAEIARQLKDWPSALGLFSVGFPQAAAAEIERQIGEAMFTPKLTQARPDLLKQLGVYDSVADEIASILSAHRRHRLGE